MEAKENTGLSADCQCGETWESMEAAWGCPKCPRYLPDYAARRVLVVDADGDPLFYSRPYGTVTINGETQATWTFENLS